MAVADVSSLEMIMWYEGNGESQQIEIYVVPLALLCMVVAALLAVWSMWLMGRIPTTLSKLSAKKPAK